jgi:hypothetical protein
MKKRGSAIARVEKMTWVNGLKFQKYLILLPNSIDAQVSFNIKLLKINLKGRVYTMHFLVVVTCFIVFMFL